MVFDTLKQRLSSSPVLVHPPPERQFVVATNASPVGIGDELAQNTPLGVQPVAYFSRILCKAERIIRHDRE